MRGYHRYYYNPVLQQLQGIGMTVERGMSRQGDVPLQVANLNMNRAKLESEIQNRAVQLIKDDIEYEYENGLVLPESEGDYQKTLKAIEEFQKDPAARIAIMENHIEKLSRFRGPRWEKGKARIQAKIDRKGADLFSLSFAEGEKELCESVVELGSTISEVPKIC